VGTGYKYWVQVLGTSTRYGGDRARTRDYELVSELSLALVYRSRKKMQLNEVERCS
jgi:hypothetical protein